MASLYDDYESYVIKYQTEYGPHTIVAYQCGGFYEIYSIQDGRVDIKDISELLNIQVSRRNKNIAEVSRSNSLMAGWPLHAMGKFIPILLEHHYTVVVVEQITPPPNPKRGVTKVLSPGTVMEGMTLTTDARYTMCVYFESSTAIGIALCDVTTGETHVHECFSTPEDLHLSFDEAWRIILQYRPCEIILVSGLNDPMTKRDLERIWNMQNMHVTDWLNKLESDMTKLVTQNTLIGQVYTNTGLLSPIEFINLERHPYALIAFVSMLRYVFRHQELLIQKLLPPSHMHLSTPSSDLVLSHNALDQLDAMGLLKILNQCVTAMGKRYFKYRMMHPKTDPGTLDTSYEQVSLYQSKGPTAIAMCRGLLKRIYDVERLFRRLQLSKATPNDFACIFESLQALEDLANTFQHVQHASIHPMKTYMETALNLPECSKYTQDEYRGSFFNAGVYPAVDERVEHISLLEKQQHDLLEALNTATGQAFFKLDQNERDGLFITCTAKRYQDTKAKLQHFIFPNDSSSSSHTNTFMMSSVKCTTLTSATVKLHHPYLDGLFGKTERAQRDLQGALEEAFKTFTREFSERFESSFQSLCHVIFHADFYSTAAHLAHQHRYTRPQLLPQEPKACVHARELRHPIVEMIQQEIPYIANDVSLGMPPHDGMLLYGLNAAGKSTLMKSIALSIWMAQAGLYVPATEFKLKPYHAIFTRMTRGDNIYTGQSTFMIEMSELRNILKRCDEHSLVIGDELCSGTETASAIGIVAAGIKHLSDRRTSFVFATHFHDLTHLSCIQEMSNLSIQHLHVEYDPTYKKLIYDRKLRTGQGATTYGIEVCKSLDVPHAFLETAHQARREYLKTTADVLAARSSTYNAHVKVKTCSICASPGAEVHHILQQKDADEHGFIQGTSTHMNRMSNLAVLCSNCHDKVHRNEIAIEGFIQTSNGIELVLQRSSPATAATVKDVEDAQHTTPTAIEELVENLRYKEKQSIQAIANQLSITQYKVRQILKRNSVFTK